jgi:hypothetical protein
MHDRPLPSVGTRQSQFRQNFLAVTIPKVQGGAVLGTFPSLGLVSVTRDSTMPHQPRAQSRKLLNRSRVLARRRHGSAAAGVSLGFSVAISGMGDIASNLPGG